MNDETKWLSIYIFSVPLTIHYSWQIFVYDDYFLYEKCKWLLPSTATDYAIVVVTMCMCTHKALESNRSLLTPFGCQWSRNGVYIKIQF